VAKYLGVAPWELAEQPAWWFHKAHEKMLAELEAAQIEADKPARTTKGRGA